MKNIATRHYQLQIKDKGTTWELYLTLPESHSHTKYFTHTFDIVKKKLPSMLRCQCDNSDHVAFADELKKTEIGHLLEHILLENLCQEKILSGKKNAEFEGRTYWSPNQKEYVDYFILIKKKKSDRSILENALKKSLALLDEILASEPNQNLIEPMYVFSDSEKLAGFETMHLSPNFVLAQ